MQHQCWLRLHLKTTRYWTAEGRPLHCHTGVRPQTLCAGLPATVGPSLWPTILCDQIDLLYLWSCMVCSTLSTRSHTS